MMAYAAGPGGALAMLAGCLVLANGCVDPEQRSTLESWAAVYHHIEKQREAGAETVSTSEIDARIGKPDYVVKGALLATVIDHPEYRTVIMELSARSFAKMTVAEKPPESAFEAIREARFWFYDEAARYKTPSQSASFWGMGTGYQLVWFVVDENGKVIAVGAYGFREPVTPAHRHKG